MRDRLRIINETRWSTRDLRRFFRAGLKAMGADLDKEITVKASRRGRIRVANPGEKPEFTGRDGTGYVHGRTIHGRASLPPAMANCQGWWITMSIPQPEFGPIRMTPFARVFEHEVAHTLGVDHKEMDPETLWSRGDLPAWADGIEILPKQSKIPKPRPKGEERDRIKLADAEAKVREFQTKIKRATTFLRKWRKRARYYERKLASRTAASKA